MIGDVKGRFFIETFSMNIAPSGSHAGEVVGAPHPEWGEQVVALAVPQQGVADRAELLDALCLENIARFKRPRRYHFIDMPPTNNYGKVLKTDLRKLLSRLDLRRHPIAVLNNIF